MTESRLPHQLRARVCSLLLPLLMLVSPGARADIVESVNKLRAQGCGAREPLRGNVRLDRLARLLAQGARLQDAQKTAGYHAVKVISLQLSGVDGGRGLEHMLGPQLCAQLGAPGYTELGAYRHGNGFWIVLGDPFIVPDPREQEAIAGRVLYLTNRARAQPRRCGGQWFPAAAALTLDPRLERAAREHSRDMAAHGYMDHTALDGSTPAERVGRAGYPWQEVGENLASGIGTADEVVAGWLRSPHHCENLMGAGYRQMGVAFGVNLDTQGLVYWTQLFGLPRS